MIIDSELKKDNIIEYSKRSGTFTALGKCQTIESAAAKDMELYINNDLIKDRIIQF